MLTDWNLTMQKNMNMKYSFSPELVDKLSTVTERDRKLPMWLKNITKTMEHWHMEVHHYYIKT